MTVYLTLHSATVISKERGSEMNIDLEYACPVISCACTPLVMYLPAINLIQNRFLVLNQGIDYQHYNFTLQIIDA